MDLQVEVDNETIGCVLLEVGVDLVLQPFHDAADMTVELLAAALLFATAATR